MLLTKKYFNFHFQEFKESSTTFSDAEHAEPDPQPAQLPDLPEAAPVESSESSRTLENKHFQ